MDQSAIKEQIFNLTLEILYLLTGEDYMIVKKPGPTTHNNRLQVVEGICRTLGNVFLTPPHSVTPQGYNEQKILDLTNKMIELLTGEVPIRCQDVTVYFSMEEWEYIEGCKDLYKDVLTENNQNTVLPDDLICKISLLHNVATPLVNEDDMVIDTELQTKNLTIQYAKDMQKISSDTVTEKTLGYENGNLSDVNHTDFSSIRIKEEPCDVLLDGGNLPNTTTHSTVQLQTICIKEEPAPHYGENLTDSNSCAPIDHTQHHPYPHIMEEPVSYGGQNLTQPSNTSTGPSQYPSTNIQEPVPHDSCNLTEASIYRPTDHKQKYQFPHILEEPASSNKADLNDIKLPTQYLPFRIKEVPLSCEDDIDIKTRRYPPRKSTSSHVKQRKQSSHNGRKRRNLRNTVKEPLLVSTISGDPKTDVDDENNSSSVYSVRQSANAMEILYHCPSCHKGFYSNLDLARHQVIHTVDKLFICSLCGKSFTEMSFLVKHQVIHTDLKLCVCQVCGGCFYSETSLAKHQKSHSLPAYCSTCGRYFIDKAELEIHERKHTGERPYACHMCGKRFIAKSVLNKHVLTHRKASK